MEATNIQTLFCVRNRRFVIPEYQRAYSWEERQLKQFVEDLQEAGDKYYLGHFLFQIRCGYFHDSVFCHYSISHPSQIICNWICYHFLLFFNVYALLILFTSLLS